MTAELLCAPLLLQRLLGVGSLIDNRQLWCLLPRRLLLGLLPLFVLRARVLLVHLANLAQYLLFLFKILQLLPSFLLSFLASLKLDLVLQFVLVLILVVFASFELLLSYVLKHVAWPRMHRLLPSR